MAARRVSATDENKRQNPKAAPRALSRACLGASPKKYKLPLLQYRVFEGFCRAQSHDSLGLDLDWFTGSRIPPHTRLACGFHGAPDTWDHKFAHALAFLYRKLKELFEKVRHSFFRHLALLGEVCNDLGLAHRVCHRV